MLITPLLEEDETVHHRDVNQVEEQGFPPSAFKLKHHIFRFTDFFAQYEMW
jgi:hypothetical protein